MTKLTKIERNWICYDVGNSAFILLVSTIIPIFFKNLASNDNISLSLSTAYFGYSLSLSTLVIVIIGPLLGSFGDRRGHRKPLFTITVVSGVICLSALAFSSNWIIFLAFLIIGRVAFNLSIIFYDSMIVDITSSARVDLISSFGYAWGYLGSTIPFIVALVLIINAASFNLTTIQATAISFIINALWWLLFTLPLIKSYHQNHYNEKIHTKWYHSFLNIKDTLSEIKANKKVVSFLIAFFFYIDGVYTIIEMATSFGKDVGIADDSLLLALLLTQLVAFPFALLFGGCYAHARPSQQARAKCRPARID